MNGTTDVAKAYHHYGISVCLTENESVEDFQLNKRFKSTALVAVLLNGFKWFNQL